MSNQVIDSNGIKSYMNVSSAGDFNILQIEDAARGMIQEAQKKVEDLTRKLGEEEENYRKRRDELAQEYKEKRDILDKELKELKEQTEKELDAHRKETKETTEKEAKEQGYQDGFKAGRKEGEKEGKEEAHRISLEEFNNKYHEEFERINGCLSEIVREMKAKHNSLFRDSEHDIVTLSISIAEKIVKREIRINPDTVLNNVKKALGIISERNSATIEVNPDDVELLGKHVEDTLNIFKENKSFNIAGNPDVQRGGCMVTSIHGGADLQIDTQIELIEQALLGEENVEKVSEGKNALERA